MSSILTAAFEFLPINEVQVLSIPFEPPYEIGLTGTATAGAQPPPHDSTGSGTGITTGEALRSGARGIASGVHSVGQPMLLEKSHAGSGAQSPSTFQAPQPFDKPEKNSLDLGSRTSIPLETRTVFWGKKVASQIISGDMEPKEDPRRVPSKRITTAGRSFSTTSLRPMKVATVSPPPMKRVGVLGFDAERSALSSTDLSSKVK
mmetsp:Transcript_60306/g.123933  ORF Transcript_60306/g.123933 Transcript_60306/m.123933 type:complete len:204 (+) Transcript_60306:938-1549(+)